MHLRSVLLKRLLNPFTVILLTVCLILPFLYIGLFNHPSSDDFFNAVWKDYLHTQVYIYKTWSGRYFANALVTLEPIHWHSFVAYRIAAICIIVLFCFALILLIYKALSAYTGASPTVRTIVASSAVVLILSNFSSLYEAFYWYTAAMTYTISEILLSFLLCIFIHLDSNPDRALSPKHYLLAVPLLVLTIGCNELIMILCLFLTLGLYLYYRHSANKRRLHFYLSLLIVCLICSAIAIFAPGNTARNSTLSRSTQTALSTWIYYSSALMRDWIFNPFLVLFSALFILFYRQYRFVRRPHSLLVAFLFPVGILFVLTFPNFWIIGTTPPGRIVNLVYVFFILGWIYFLLHLAATLQDILAGDSTEMRAVRQLIPLLSVVAIIASFNMHDLRNSNYFIIAKSLSLHIPQKFNKDMIRRYAIIKSTTSDTVVVPRIPRDHLPGNILFYTDLGPDPTKFPNPGLARYWGKAQLYVSPDTLSHPSE